MKTKENKGKKKIFVLTALCVVTAFFVSFAASAFVFMNSQSLVFSKNEKELKRLTFLLGEKDSEIAGLKYELERYKALYEAELRDNPPMEIDK